MMLKLVSVVVQGMKLRLLPVDKKKPIVLKLMCYDICKIVPVCLQLT